MAAVAVIALSPLAVAGSVQAAAPAGAVTAKADHPTTHRADPTFGPSQRRAATTEARQERTTTARQLRLDDQQALVVKDVQRDVDGVEHVRYERTYAGLPVIGGDLVVHQTEAGAPQTVDWASKADIDLKSTSPSVAATEVRGNGPRKVVYAVGGKPVLAWESTVRGTEKDGTPVRDLVYTDARTGQQLAVVPQVQTDTGSGSSLYSGTVSLTTAASGSSWTLTDGSRGGHKTYDATGITSESDYRTGTLFSDADNVWGTGATSSKQSAAVDAHYGAALTWDFYKNTFGRTGIRNDGVAAFSRVHFGNSYENAFWDDACFCMTYGDGGSSLKPLVALDVAGHEMSHGVTSATSGLDYSGDAGGLNEATSDVMGTMVEFSANNATDPGDYYIGEKIMKDGTYLRRMDNPSADGGSVNCWSTSTRNLDPHYSSGVGNHLFYLLSEGTGSKTIGGKPHSGSTCNGSTLTGIGRANAAARVVPRDDDLLDVDHDVPAGRQRHGQGRQGPVRRELDAVRGHPGCVEGRERHPHRDLHHRWRRHGQQPARQPRLRVGRHVMDGELRGDHELDQRQAACGLLLRLAGRVRHEPHRHALPDRDGAGGLVGDAVLLPLRGHRGDREHGLRQAHGRGHQWEHDDTKATYSNANASAGYVQKTIDLSAYTGKTITVKITGTEDSSAATSFLLDDTSLTTG